MNKTDSRLRGLLATLALVGFMVGVPVVLIAIDALPDPSAFTWSRLTSQDDGTLALQVITASAYLARQDPAASAPHIQKIERNARLAHSIVDDLMSLARGEPTHAEPILLYDVLVAARAEIEPGAARWDDAISPADVRVRAHAGLVTRLFHALYENAIHASAPRPPTITTRAWREVECIVIEVGDDDFVPATERLADREADQSDERSGVQAEGDLVRVARVDESRDAGPGPCD